MRLKLTVEMPSSVDENQALSQLLIGRVEGQGITITTAAGYTVDVDLIDVERAVPVSLAEGVTP